MKCINSVLKEKQVIIIPIFVFCMISLSFVSAETNDDLYHEKGLSKNIDIII